MIENFLTDYDLVKRPILLGLSGGPDSMALFYLLLEAKHPFHVAHVDHGWRPESQEEAAILEKLCKEKSIPFHTTRLALEGANLEDRSRKERHLFFEKICSSEKLVGVFLAHHADDQAETVLKRVFEGATLPKLRGLLPKTEIGSLTLYRPLLKQTKEEIVRWLDARRIPYFSDPTNQDARYLRSRMRKVILPTLSEQFGKQVAPSLIRIAESAEELACFLHQTIAPFLQQLIENDEEIILNFNCLKEQTPFIRKAVIRSVFEKCELSLSTAIVETIGFHLEKMSSQKCIQVGKNRVELNRGVLTIKKLKKLRLPVA